MVVCAVLLCAPTALAVDPEGCAVIENSEERLACYDSTFSVEDPASAPEESPEVNPVEATGRAVISEETITAPPSGLPGDTASTEPAASKSGEEKQTGWLGDELVNFSSTITAILAGDKQKMVFQLENGQVWLQSSPRRLPFKEGDVVTVKNALLGGYFMRSKKGVSTRVQRIR
jgi:hypothetical protein